MESREGEIDRDGAQYLPNFVTVSFNISLLLIQFEPLNFNAGRRGSISHTEGSKVARVDRPVQLTSSLAYVGKPDPGIPTAKMEKPGEQKVRRESLCPQIH